MSDLTLLEKRKFEQLIQMGNGYVLNFSNRTFDDFTLDSIDRVIDYKYGSKANRLRATWEHEENRILGKLMGDLLAYGVEEGFFKDQEVLIQTCRKIITRLLQGGPVAELAALAAISDEKDFETVAKAVRDSIEKNEPGTGLDRLHTFVMKYVRTLCAQHGVTVTREKPLHSLFGEYVKRLREGGHIESRMAELILKSSISVLEAFNDVRNNRSLAHDNAILQYDEALLIFNHVASSIRFLKSLENEVQSKREQADHASNDAEDVPF
jgi:Abortive infection C-terminus